MTMATDMTLKTVQALVEALQNSAPKQGNLLKYVSAQAKGRALIEQMQREQVAVCPECGCHFTGSLDGQYAVRQREEAQPVAWRVRRSGDEQYELFFNREAAQRRAECFVPPRKAEPLYATQQPESRKEQAAPHRRSLVGDQKPNEHDESLLRVEDHGGGG
jgi:hypothetical protein